MKKYVVASLLLAVMTSTSYAAGSFTVTVSRNGTGTGSVGSTPRAIDCGSPAGRCSGSFMTGTRVTLVPASGVGSTFVQWVGCPSVSGQVCIISDSRSRTVTATFAKQQTKYNLQVWTDGLYGTVTSSPAGISKCGAPGGKCGADFNANSTVSLIPSPIRGRKFSGWNGCDSIRGTTCIVTMKQSKYVQAYFK